MPHFEEEQVQLAREIDIIDFIQRYENFTFKPAGHSYKCIEHDSLIVKQDRKGWYWNSRDIGGANAIDYLQRIHGLSFSEAVNTLIGEQEYQKTNITPIPEAKKAVREFSLPERTDGKFTRAFAYLNKSRMINSNIISELMHNNKIYQDKNGNVVFVGFDSDNNPRNAAYRGTLSNVKYRGEAAGSDKRFGFSMDGTVKNTLYVFESPIDAMSHASLAAYILENKDAWKQHSRISLGGCTDLALEQYLSDHQNVKTIVFCLDNDEAGRSATDKFLKKYSEQGFSVRSRPPKEKDYNDDLKSYLVGELKEKLALEKDKKQNKMLR